jgi:hypothetical protein
MSDRDGKGRFAKGNKAAVGRPTKRVDLARAVRDAMPVDRLRVILERLLELAESGDLDATRLVLAYAIGRPREAPTDPIEVELPAVQSVADLNACGLAIVDAIRSGALDPDAGMRVLDALRRMVDLDEHARIIPELEGLREMVREHTTKPKNPYGYHDPS